MATPVAPANTTVQGIRTEIREYVGISSNSILPDQVIDQEMNYFYTANIPESIKLDQLRTVYVLYTIPFCDRYPIDTNQFQSFREPLLIDGIGSRYYKDRALFYSYWPNVRTYLQPGMGDGVTTNFTFTLAGTPICRTTFTISCPDNTGFQLIAADSPQGLTTQGTLLQIRTDNTGLQTPPTPPTSPIPPNPLPTPPYTNQIGTINYQTGQVNINFPTPPAAGQAIQVQFYAATNGRPAAALYWNNEIILRPIPKFTHKIELEAYQTPAQFLTSTDHPFLNNFKRYIALGCSINLLSRMGDVARKAELEPDFFAAEGRVLERQANEEIGQANATIFNQAPSPYPQYPYGGYWY